MVTIALITTIISSLFGCMLLETYEVIFVVDGEETVVSVNYNEHVEIPEINVPEGYDFNGWFLDDQTFTISAESIYINKIQDNYTLYAKLSPILKDIQFLDEDNQTYYRATIDYFTDIPFPDEPPMSEGYTFVKWVLFSDDKDVVIYKPEFVPSVYTVTFFDQNGEVHNVQEVTHGSQVTPPVSPEKSRHVFVSWDQDLSQVTSDLEVYPVFEKLKHTVTFLDADKGIFQSMKIVDGEFIALPDEHPEKDEHIFKGWDVDLDNPVLDNLIIEPIFEAITYTLVFYTADDELYTSISGTFSDDILYPEAPIVEGYVFDSWSYTEEVFFESTNVYPIYKLKTYTVTFQNEDQTIYEQMMVSHNDPLPVVDYPTKDHYLFVGWDKDIVTVTEDLIITAIFEPESYTVNFVNDDDFVLSTEEVTYLMSATAPDEPIKKGYVFTGWDQEFNSVSQDMIIRAVYELDIFDLHFEMLDGTNIASISIPYQEAIILPEEPIKYGYTFDGWYDEEFTEEFNLAKMPAEDVIVYAKWVAQTVQISIVSEGEPITTVHVAYGSLYDDIIIDEKGYTLLGFRMDSVDDLPTLALKTVETVDQHEIYAIWKANEYLVTFNLNAEEALIERDHINVTFDSTYRDLPVPTRLGYTFMGWSLSDDALIDENTLVSTDIDHTLYAKWQINSYQVAYYDDIEQISVNALSYQSLLETPEKTGYTFIGWYTDINLTSEVIIHVPATDISVYAKWEEISYTITYDLDHGAQNPLNPEYYTIEDEVTLNNPTRQGYIFMGWYQNDTYTTDVISLIVNQTGDLNLYAKWEATSYKVVYLSNSNGVATGSMSDQMATYDEKLSLANNQYVFDNLKFNGWSRYPNANPLYDAGDETINLSNDGSTVYLYATWVAIVQFKYPGGYVFKEHEVHYNTALNYYPTVPVEFYEFEGWYTDRTEGNRVNESTIITRSVSFYARWVEGEEWRDYIHIYNVSEFLAIYDDPDAQYVIMNNLDFNGMELLPIPYFNGVLFGLNKTLSNYQINSFVSIGTGINDTNEYYGLIGELNGTIKNLTFSGTVTVTESDFDFDKEVIVGGIVASNLGTIINTHHQGIINVEGFIMNTIAVGGVSSINDGTITLSSNKGSINLSTRSTYLIFVGGISAVTFKNVDRVNNSGSITVISTTNDPVYVGGLIGRINFNEIPVELKNSFNTGRITVKITSPSSIAHTSVSVGGLVGSSSYASILSSYNSGFIDASFYASNKYCQFLNLGGIIGYMGNHDIASVVNHTYNIGDLKASSGTTYDDGSITIYMGGLVGRTSSVVPAIIKNSYVAYTEFMLVGGKLYTIITGGIIGYNNYSAGSNLHWLENVNTIASNTASTITKVYHSVYDMLGLASVLDQDYLMTYWMSGAGTLQVTPRLWMNN